MILVGLGILRRLEKLKQALTSSPVLALPIFDEPFVIECDASSTRIGLF